MRNSRTEAFKIVKASFAVDNLVVDNKGLQAINDYVTGSKTFEQARNTLVDFYEMFFEDALHYYLTEEDFYDDPFCDENGVLINNLGISNTKDLNEAEKALSALQNTRLQENISVFLGNFDLQHLQNIHHQLFMDVYP